MTNSAHDHADSYPLELSGLDHVDWPAIQDLLQSGQYGRAAIRLAGAVRVCEQANLPLHANFLAAIRELCLVCAQCQTQAEWYAQIHTQIDHQEHAFRAYLFAIIELLGRSTGETMTLDAPRPEGPPLLQRIQGGLLTQFIQGLLGRGPSSPNPPSTDPPTRYNETPAPTATPNLPANGNGQAGITNGTAHHDAALHADEARAAESPRTNSSLPATASQPANGSGSHTASLPHQANTAANHDGHRPDAPDAAPDAPADPSPDDDAPLLAIYCLGAFRVYQDDQPLEDWPSRKGKTLLKYLVLNRDCATPKEVLMDLFWPDAGPDAARNNLNVAIYGLRQAFHQGRPDFSHILFQDGSYLLNPDMHVWLDTEAFLAQVRSGRALEQRGEHAQAAHEYTLGASLYAGSLLQEDIYEAWLGPKRQYLQDTYLNMMLDLSAYHLESGDYIACVAACNKLLVDEPCLEEIHRRLMICYSRQGQRYLALRQYHQCVQNLRDDLAVEPMPETLDLHAQLARGEAL